MFGDQNILYGLAASVFAAGVSTAGIVAMTFHSAWCRRNSAYFSAFAVGLLTVGVMFHLVPEAISLSNLALAWVAVGFTIMVLVGIGVEVSLRDKPDGAALTFGYASIITLGAHSLLAGVIYAASFQENPFTGFLATAGLMFHEFPEGVIAVVLLMAAGLNQARAMTIAFFAAAVTTVAGAVFAYFLLSLTNGIPLAMMLGGAAGGLVYVLIVHLGPHAAKAPNHKGYEFAAYGVVVATIALVLNQLAMGGH